MMQARCRASAVLGVLWVGGVVVACGGSTSTGRLDGAMAGSGGARTFDGGADATSGTGGGAGGSGGFATGGRSGPPDASAGGTTSTGGRSAGGATGTGGIGGGGAGGGGGIDAAGAGGTSIDARGSGGLDAGGTGGSGGIPGTGGTAGRDAGAVDRPPPGIDSGADARGLDGGSSWPATLARCSDATDEHLSAVVYEGSKAPAPYDWSANPGGTLTWSAACASDLASARLLAAQALAVVDREDAASPYFYEFADETSRTYDQVYRATKCEFYDGAVLGTPYRSLDGLGLVASYLWFAKNRSNSSAKIVAGAPVATAATVDQFFLCSTLTVYGDWGMYDEIRYYEQRHTLDASGTVVIGTEQLLRTIQGKYHPNP